MATKSTKPVKAVEEPKAEAKAEAKVEKWEQGKKYTLKSTHVRVDRILLANTPVELTEKEWKELKGDLC